MESSNGLWVQSLVSTARGTTEPNAATELSAQPLDLSNLSRCRASVKSFSQSAFIII
jgi:hypothetical protein